MKNEVILHIGLHKTGTTFLQDNIFPYFNDLSIIRAWHNQKTIVSQDLKAKILITYEGFSGDPWVGNYHDQFCQNIHNLKKLYSDPKIIIGFRKHSSLILSLYKQYLHQKGTENLDYLFNYQNTGVLKHEDLFFYNKVNLLQKEFKDVFIYFQEDLNNNLGTFIRSLSQFLETSFEFSHFELETDKNYNLGVKTELQVNLLRYLNKVSISRYCPNLYGVKMTKYKWTPRDICQYRLSKVKGPLFRLPEDLKEFIDDYYEQDWQRVSNLYGNG